MCMLYLLSFRYLVLQDASERDLWSILDELSDSDITRPETLESSKFTGCLIFEFDSKGKLDYATGCHEKYPFICAQVAGEILSSFDLSIVLFLLARQQIFYLSLTRV